MPEPATDEHPARPVVLQSNRPVLALCNARHVLATTFLLTVDQSHHLLRIQASLCMIVMVLPHHIGDANTRWAASRRPRSVGGLGQKHHAIALRNASSLSYASADSPRAYTKILRTSASTHLADKSLQTASAFDGILSCSHNDLGVPRMTLKSQPLHACMVPDLW